MNEHCEICGKLMRKCSPVKRFCAACRKQKHRIQSRIAMRGKYKQQQKTCTVCGRSFVGLARYYCGPDCRAIGNREKRRIAAAELRAKNVRSAEEIKRQGDQAEKRRQAINRLHKSGSANQIEKWMKVCLNA